MEPIHLSSDELTYELQIRGITGVKDKRAATKAIRDELRDEESGNKKSPYDNLPPLSNQSDIAAVASKLKILVDKANITTKDGRINEPEILLSRTIHLSKLTDRLFATDPENVRDIEKLRKELDTFMNILKTSQKQTPADSQPLSRNINTGTISKNINQTTTDPEQNIRNNDGEGAGSLDMANLTIQSENITQNLNNSVSAIMTNRPYNEPINRNDQMENRGNGNYRLEYSNHSNNTEINQPDRTTIPSIYRNSNVPVSNAPQQNPFRYVEEQFPNSDRRFETQRPIGQASENTFRQPRHTNTNRNTRGGRMQSGHPSTYRPHNQYQYDNPSFPTTTYNPSVMRQQQEYQFPNSAQPVRPNPTWLTNQATITNSINQWPPDHDQQQNTRPFGFSQYAASSNQASSNQIPITGPSPNFLRRLGNSSNSNREQGFENRYLDERPMYTPNHFRRTNPVAQWNIAFSGDDKKTSLNDFLSQVALFARAERISENELLASAIYLFSGPAKMWYRAFHSHFQSWGELVEALRYQFLPNDYDFWLIREIEERRQGEHENFGIFLASIEMLFSNLSYNVPEQYKLDVIMRNMLPMYSERLSMIDINSVFELAVKCKRIEQMRFRIDKHWANTLQSSDFLEPAFSNPRRDANETLAISRRFRPNSQSQSQSNTGPTELVCFNCRGQGHHFNDCSSERKVFCYRCGRVGVKSIDCPNCKSVTGNANAGLGEGVERAPQSRQSQTPMKREQGTSMDQFLR